MSNSIRRYIQRFSSVVTALILGLLASSFAPYSASAGFTTCRSDPVVTLSDGAQVDLQAGITDDMSDVQGVVYTVHIPTGTEVVSIVNTDGLLGLKETILVHADDPADTYDSTTVAHTAASSVDVTATTTVVSALGVTLGSKSTSGVSGQPLSVHVAPLL